MPFEPLKTDEKLEGPPPKQQSPLEKQLMSGCMVILLTCVIVYGLCLWPWFTFQGHTVSGLVKALTFGAGSSIVLGIFVTLKYGMAGASGFLGGAFVAAVFMFLRIQQYMLGKGHNDLQQPEYPERWQWLVPLAWVLLAVVIVAIFLPKETDDHPAAPETDQ